MPGQLLNKWAGLAALLVVCVAALLIWSANKKPPLMRHDLTGVVVAVMPEARKIKVHNDDMPGMMRPMEMDYDVKDAAALARLKAGDSIHATLVTNNEDIWQLENVNLTAKTAQ